MEPGSLTGEANGAEMQLLEAFGVRGGVGLPGTGLCWKLEMAVPPPPFGTAAANISLVFRGFFYYIID